MKQSQNGMDFKATSKGDLPYIQQYYSSNYLPIGLSLICVVQAVTWNVLNHVLLLVWLVITADGVAHGHLLGKFLFSFRI